MGTSSKNSTMLIGTYIWNRQATNTLLPTFKYFFLQDGRSYKYTHLSLHTSDGEMFKGN